MTLSMIIFLLGLVSFLGLHSIRIIADDWRTKRIAQLGEKGWKGLYSIVSLLGFATLVWGASVSRADSALLWSPVAEARPIALLLMAIAFVLLVAAYVPGTHIKTKLGHPMLAATMLWSFAHLLTNGSTVDALLFGAFLFWSLCAFISARARDKSAGKLYPAIAWSRDAIALAAGLLAWAFFAHTAHQWIVGVAIF